MADLPVEARGPVPSRIEDVTRRGTFAAVGAVGAAFLGSLCCIGPLLFVSLGAGAGLASTFEPLRPVLVGLTVALLGVGFYSVYWRQQAACSVDARRVQADSCPAPRYRARSEVVLWVGTALALMLLSFPVWSKLLV